MYYLENGQEVQLVSKFSDGAVVRPIFESRNEDGEPWLGDPEVVAKVFDEPPVPRINQLILEAETRLQSARDELRSVKSETKSILDQKKAVDKMVGTRAAIQRVYDFLVTGITHVVECKYGKAVLIDVKKTRSGDDKWSRDLKLVSLFGRSNGDLAWHIHQYSDGSGNGDSECVPFTNEADAISFAKQRISEFLVDEKNYWLEYTIQSAASFGVDVPASAIGKVNSRKLLDAEANLAKHLKYVADHQSEIAKLKGTAS